MSFSLFFPQDVVRLCQNDTLPVLNLVIKDDQEPPQPIDITGYSVFFTFKKNSVAYYRFKREMLQIDPVNGLVGLNWKPGDLAVPGRYKGEVEICFPDGGVQTQVTPFDFEVRAQLDATVPLVDQVALGTPGTIYREDLSSQVAVPPGRTEFSTTYLFVPGTLRVFRNGLDLGPSGVHFTEDISEQRFTIYDSVLEADEELFVLYVVGEH